MTTPRRHHYLPRCYLRGFAVERKKRRHQLVVYDRERRETYPTAIENVGVERDFNRVEIEGIDPNAVETGMAEFETELAEVLRRTGYAAAFQTEEDRIYFLNFIALLALRNPRWRETWRQFREEVSFTVLSLALSSRERWEQHVERARRGGFMDGVAEVDYDVLKQQHLSKDYRVDVSTTAHIQNELHHVDTILPFLEKRKWLFLRASKQSAGFVTCDHPLVLVWSDPSERGKFMPPGFGMPNTEIIFPLTSRVAMIGAFEIENGVREMSEIGVALVNGAPVASSQRHVYARDHNFLYSLSREGGIRKASRLLDDKGFQRRAKASQGQEDGIDT